MRLSCGSSRQSDLGEAQRLPDGESCAHLAEGCDPVANEVVLVGIGETLTLTASRMNTLEQVPNAPTNPWPAGITFEVTTGRPQAVVGGALNMPSLSSRTPDPAAWPSASRPSRSR